jgi:ribonucleotide reductase alpha subunit
MSFENPLSCCYTRTTLSGDFIIINKYLVNKLLELGLWNNEMKQQLLLHDGSIQGIQGIPENIKEIYKTAWEISQKHVLDQCRDRGVFIDQGISMNVYLEKPTVSKVSSMLMYGWKLGLKTGCYYLRSKAVTAAAKITVGATIENDSKNQELYPVCNINDPTCESCSA